jgi:hypothetical protein
MPTLDRLRGPLAGAALLTAFAILVVTSPPELDALQRMAGYNAEKSFFGDVQKYLENLRDSLIPLTIPLGAIGLTGGAAAYMVGNMMAQKILGGVIIGIALALLGPSLVA